MFSSQPCMRRFAEFEEGIPVMRDEEYMLQRFPNTSFTFKKAVPAEVGELYFTSQRIMWFNTEICYDFDVPFIALHAITKDPASFPVPCIYCQFDCGDDMDGPMTEEEGDGEDGEPDECFIIPEDAELLQQIFDVFSQAALLNPDPEEDEEEGGLGDEMFYNEEEVSAGALQAMASWESKFIEPSFPIVSDPSSSSAASTVQFAGADATGSDSTEHVPTGESEDVWRASKMSKIE